MGIATWLGRDARRAAFIGTHYRSWDDGTLAGAMGIGEAAVAQLRGAHGWRRRVGTVPGGDAPAGALPPLLFRDDVTVQVSGLQKCRKTN